MKKEREKERKKERKGSFLFLYFEMTMTATRGVHSNSHTVDSRYLDRAYLEYPLISK